MKYKAFLIDIDGTLVANNLKALPSSHTQEMIALARKKIHIGVATGRPRYLADNIINNLALSGPSIFSGGAQVMDTISGKIYYEQPILQEDMRRVYEIFRPHNIPLYMTNPHIDKDMLLTDTTDTTGALDIFSPSLLNEKADMMLDEISHIPTIAAHKSSSWDVGKVSVHITHASATKQHAVYEVAKVLGITNAEIITIGESYNDFPLLMAGGLKIAMGNAVPELKAIADYIAPSVYDDGVAHVIEKFILGKQEK